MRWKVAVALIALLALFPGPLVDGCRAVMHGALTAGQAALDSVSTQGSGHRG